MPVLKIRNLLLSIALVISALACFVQTTVALSSNSLTVSRQTTVLDSEEYAVYSEILNQHYIGRRLAVIRDRTFVDKLDGYGARVAQRIQELLSPAVETVDDYKEKSAKSYQLERRFDLRVPFVLITAKQD